MNGRDQCWPKNRPVGVPHKNKMKIIMEHSTTYQGGDGMNGV